MTERGTAQRLAPYIVVGLVALLVVLSAGTSWLVARHFRQDAASTTRIYSRIFAGLNSPQPGAEAEALLRLAEEVRQRGIPLVVTDATGRVTASANLPLDSTATEAEIRAYARELDLENPPIVDEQIGTVHYGPVPAKRQLTALAVLQGLTIATMVGVAYFAYRNAMNAQQDRVWVGMAREAAHQLGTPLSSLHGWIEQLRAHSGEWPAIADHLTADAERLDRVAQRFERIGNPARRDPVALGALADRVAGYYRPRLPRHANAIELKVDAPGPGPVVLGDPVLLEWALEALVKNAIDALSGRQGTITLRARSEDGVATLRVIDDGPGVPKELRREIFQPGITTKRGGWGIGLALCRRAIEDAHAGQLLLESVDSGTSFLIRLPQHAA
ncbi:MAG: sensor histidine kinase [Gemmatimonadota bacterium]